MKNIIMIMVVIGLMITVNADIECILCQKSIDLVKHLISKNATREEIKKEADKICITFPDTYRSRCIKFMNENIDKIINLIDKIPDDKICMFIGMCKENEKVDIKCNICQFLVNQIAIWLEEGKTEDMILNELKKMCYIFHPYDKQCNAIISAYGKQLIEFIVTKGKEDACKFIGLCPTIATTSEMECSLCKFSIDYITKWLDEGKTSQEITKDLKKLCGELGKLEVECCSFVDYYTKNIIHYIKAKKNNICIRIHACPSSSYFIFI
jgi:hypothetical protein